MGHAVSLRIRKPALRDAKFLWQLRNQKAVRKASFNMKKIPWAGHENWLLGRLKDPKVAFYLISKGPEPIGQIRFDRKSKAAVVNISISKEFTGKGFGARAVKMATRKYLKNHSVNQVIAFAKEKNRASVNCFEKAGYANKGKTIEEGFRCVKLVCGR